MRQEATAKQERRVQPSGRPCGAPSGLDAKRSLCERPPQAKSTTLEEPFQTPNHNLIPTQSGPTIGVHLRVRARNGVWVQGIFARLANSLFMEWRSHRRKPHHHSTTDFTALMAADHGRRVLLTVTARRPNLHSAS